MNEIIEKLKGVLTEEDLSRLQTTLQRMVTEAVETKTAEAKKELALLQEEFINKEVARLTEEKVAIEKTLLEESYANRSAEFEKDIASKLSMFLESEVATKISDDMVAKIALNEIYEPVINGVMKVFEEKYVAIDTEGHTIMMEAKEEIDRLEKVHSEKIKENMLLTEENNRLKTKVLIEEKCFGLNQEQKNKVVLMFESKNYSEVETGIEKFIDVLIESEVKETNTNKELLTESAENLDTEKELRDEKVPTNVQKASRLL